MKLDKDETATILAALRHWQRTATNKPGTGRSAGHFDDAEELGDEEIDALCERINSEDPLDEIHALLDGKEWDSDTTSAIADVLTRNGYVVRDIDDMPDEEDDGIDLTDNRVAQAMGEARGEEPS